MSLAAAMSALLTGQSLRCVIAICPDFPMLNCAAGNEHCHARKEKTNSTLALAQASEPTVNLLFSCNRPFVYVFLVVDVFLLVDFP